MTVYGLLGNYMAITRRVSFPHLQSTRASLTTLEEIEEINHLIHINLFSHFPLGFRLALLALGLKKKKRMLKPCSIRPDLLSRRFQVVRYENRSLVTATMWFLRKSFGNSFNGAPQRGDKNWLTISGFSTCEGSEMQEYVEEYFARLFKSPCCNWLVQHD
jgi:hypothetical protein